MIAMTAVMALCSIVGGIGSVLLGMRSPVLPRVCAFKLFGALQVAAMWISFLRPFANRCPPLKPVQVRSFEKQSATDRHVLGGEALGGILLI